MLSAEVEWHSPDLDGMWPVIRVTDDEADRPEWATDVLEFRFDDPLWMKALTAHLESRYGITLEWLMWARPTIVELACVITGGGGKTLDAPSWLWAWWELWRGEGRDTPWVGPMTLRGEDG